MINSNRMLSENQPKCAIYLTPLVLGVLLVGGLAWLSVELFDDGPEEAALAIWDKPLQDYTDESDGFSTTTEDVGSSQTTPSLDNATESTSSVDTGNGTDGSVSSAATGNGTDGSVSSAATGNGTDGSVSLAATGNGTDGSVSLAATGNGTDGTVSSAATGNGTDGSVSSAATGNGTDGSVSSRTAIPVAIGNDTETAIPADTTETVKVLKGENITTTAAVETGNTTQTAEAVGTGNPPKTGTSGESIINTTNTGVAPTEKKSTQKDDNSETRTLPSALAEKESSLPEAVETSESHSLSPK
ncbi:polysialoglycoprotein-like isoform X3 [Penaeus japonicus]|uniref:polysialoglycoprotein-like isoform X3 n=1 Tax=Penaeus japonicus TaxID=27405 RepID=UPI001C71243F|nr:polysialoglycoprotein-like isoform X3 [Penaeus japonicus]